MRPDLVIIEDESRSSAITGELRSDLYRDLQNLDSICDVLGNPLSAQAAYPLDENLVCVQDA
jgi:hypothetical protein